MNISFMLSGVILAAGESSRMGMPKALLKYHDLTFPELIVSRFKQAGITKILLVLGAKAEEIEKEVPLSGIEIVINPDYQQGQLSSLKIALAALPQNSEGILLTLVDHPLVKLETYQSLITAWQATRPSIVLPEFEGKGGHPVVFDRFFFSQLLATPFSQGARQVVYQNPARVIRVKVNDPAVRQDIDTPQDYQEVLAQEND